MTAFEIGKFLIQVLLVSGAAGLVSLLTIRQQKRKLLSESGKTDAEADTVLADAYSRRAATQVTLLEPYERVMERQQQEIEEQAREIRWLKDCVEALTQALRAQGIAVPAMPARPETPVTDRTRRNRGTGHR